MTDTYKLHIRIEWHRNDSSNVKDWTWKRGEKEKCQLIEYLWLENMQYECKCMRSHCKYGTRIKRKYLPITIDRMRYFTYYVESFQSNGTSAIIIWRLSATGWKHWMSFYQKSCTLLFFFALCDVPHLLKSLSFFSLLHLCSEASHRKRSCTLWAKRNSLSRTFIFMYRLRIRVIGFLCCEAISRALNTIKEQIFPLWLLLEIRMWALPIFFTTSTLSNHPKYWFSIKLPNIIKKVPNATHPNTNSILNHTKLTICHLHNVY